MTSVIKAKSGEPPGKLGWRRSRQKKKKSSQTLTPLPTNVMMMINELVRFFGRRFEKLRAKFISREATSGMISLARKWKKDFQINRHGTA